MKDKLKFLQIDSSNENFLFIKLYLNGQESHILIEEKRCHLKKLVPAIREILNSNDSKLIDLDFIALNEGPGSWTGLRIAFSTIKIISQVNNVKVIVYSNFDNLLEKCLDGNGVFLVKASQENYYFYVMLNNNPIQFGVISNTDLKDFYPEIKRYFYTEKDFDVNNILIDRYTKNEFADSSNMEPFYLAEGVITNKF